MLCLADMVFVNPQEVGTRDEYFSRFDPHEEHDAFRRAEQRLEERHREKVSKVDFFLRI